MMFFSSYWQLFVILAIIAFTSVKTPREDERLVIFRLGRFLKIGGPGLVFLIPFVDRGVKINLTEKFPGWQGWSKVELEEKIKNLVMNKPSA